VKETCERCGKKKKKQVSDVAAADSLDNCEQTVVSCGAGHAVIERYLLAAAAPQQQTRRTLLQRANGTETDGHRTVTQTLFRILRRR